MPARPPSRLPIVRTAASEMKTTSREQVQVRGARENNLKNVDVDIPREALVVFSGISGSGKSSLAFGTLYAEAQRRYLESVSPYARRLIDQVGAPDVDSIVGLPPAVALKQQVGATSARSSVGSITTISNLLRMLFSRAGDYPAGQPMLHAEDFSTNTPQGACPRCHGLGRIYEVTEKSLVPEASLTIREGAIAAWPAAWQGQNLRDILVSLGYDIDKPWRSLSRRDRDWILLTDEQPTVPVYAGYSPAQTRRALKRKEEPSYMGTFMGARKYVLHTFATTQSVLMKRRAARYMIGALCPVCRGKRLQARALSVRFGGRDISDVSAMPAAQLAQFLRTAGERGSEDLSPEKALAAHRIVKTVLERISTLQGLGLGYLSLDRRTPTLSPGELQRLRLATQIHSNLFGVVYVLDEPSAGLHPADEEALITALEQLKRSGNSLFIVEHDLEIMRRADWIVDVGPGAGEQGGRILYSGTPEGLRHIANSATARYLFETQTARSASTTAEHEAQVVKRSEGAWLRLRDVTINNLHHVDAAFPLGRLTGVTGVSGSGKSSLVAQALPELVATALGHDVSTANEELSEHSELETPLSTLRGGQIDDGIGTIRRLVIVDQKPIGRTPRSNLATYTGLFDHVRRLFAATPAAKARRFRADRFSFNLASGRCETCEGEGFLCVELLFMPSAYAPCPTCGGARYNPETLKIQYGGKSVADVLKMTVQEAVSFFADQPAVRRSLALLDEIGLGYLRLGQPATELSGGEAQRIKLANELQRADRGRGLYILDEPTTGLHAADVDRLMGHLRALVAIGNTVVIIEHDMRVAVTCDWLIEMGPGAGTQGGQLVDCGTPEEVARRGRARSAPYLKAAGTPPVRSPPRVPEANKDDL